MSEKRERTFKRVEKLSAQGKYEPAIKLLQEFIEQDKNDITVINLLANTYDLAGKKREAVDYFFQSAEHYYERQFYNRSIAIYKKIIKIDSENGEIYEKLSRINKETGNVREASKNLKIASRKFRQDGNFTRAMQTLTKARDLSPKDQRLRLELIELYKERGNTEKAIEEYLIFAENFKIRGDLQGARTILENILKLDADNVPALAKMAEIASLQGNKKETLSIYQRIFSIDPDNVQTILSFSDEYLKRFNDLETTINMLKKAHQLDPENIDILLKIKELDPKDLEIRQALKVYYLDCGEKERAMGEIIGIAEIFEETGKHTIATKLREKASQMLEASQGTLKPEPLRAESESVELMTPEQTVEPEPVSPDIIHVEPKAETSTEPAEYEITPLQEKMFEFTEELPDAPQPPEAAPVPAEDREIEEKATIVEPEPEPEPEKSVAAEPVEEKKFEPEVSKLKEIEYVDLKSQVAKKTELKSELVEQEQDSEPVKSVDKTEDKVEIPVVPESETKEKKQEKDKITADQMAKATPLRTDSGEVETVFIDDIDIDPTTLSIKVATSKERGPTPEEPQLKAVDDKPGPTSPPKEKPGAKIEAKTKIEIESQKEAQTEVSNLLTFMPEDAKSPAQTDGEAASVIPIAEKANQTTAGRKGISRKELEILQAEKSAIHVNDNFDIRNVFDGMQMPTDVQTEEEAPSISFSDDTQNLKRKMQNLLDSAVDSESTLTTEDDETRYNLAVSYMEMALYEDAISELLILSESRKYQLKAYQMLGLAYSYRQQSKEAIDCYLKTLDLLPPDSEERAETLFSIGDLYLMMNDFKNAHKHFMKVFHFNSNYPGLMEKLDYINTSLEKK